MTILTSNKSTKWKQFFTCNSSPNVATYPQLPDSIIYLRIALGIIYGLSLGYRESSQDVSITGAVGIIFGVNVVVFLPILYLTFYLNAQIDSYKSINFAGVMNGLAAMMLVWVTCFTALHEVEMEALSGAVLKTMVDVVVSGEEGEGLVDSVVDEPSEF